MREKLLWVCWPPWVAITKYHKLVAKITEVYFHSSRGSEVQDQGTGEDIEARESGEDAFMWGRTVISNYGIAG
uniref:Sorting nexin 14 n=1 Tax=Rousettus aegyptiacus TaxID=9407 RepID=A0A7J8KH25_ROUAE|nr:sorting nexin 14 [Rousettus aegyptiacus]